MKTALASILIPFLSLFITTMTTSTAWAHAVLVYSSPADQAVLKSAPHRAVLRFNGRIEKKIMQIHLLDSKGRKTVIPMKAGTQASGAPDSLEFPLPSLAPGQYRLWYRVLAADGHATLGMIRFNIDNAGKS